MLTTINPAELIVETATSPGKTSKQMEDAHDFQVISAPAAEGGQIALALVADGIGGHAAGEEASRLAVEVIKEYFETNKPADIPGAITASMVAANGAILKRAAAEATMQGMGTTITLAAITSSHLCVGSLGDSRAYLFRDGDLKRLTHDHTWAQEAIDSGRLTAAEAKVHPNRNVLRRYAGISQSIRVDVRPLETVQPGDTVLLCTDGLTDLVEDAEIKDILLTNPPKQAVRKLVNLAMERGGYDNITVMVVQAAESGKKIVRPATAFALPRSSLIVGLAAGVLLVAVIFLTLRQSGLQPNAPPTATVEVVSFASPVPTVPASPTLQQLGTNTIPTVTPVLTFTPASAEAGWTPPPPPILRTPPDGLLFSGPQASVILSWDSVGALPPDVYYVVTIKKFVAGQLVLTYDQWTKETRVELDPSFYLALIAHGRQLAANDLGDGKGPGMILLQETPPARFEWFVTLKQLTQINPDGTKEGTQLGSPSQTLTFLWGPPSPVTPTLVYGGQTFDTDPFFAEQENREARAGAILFPVSILMAGTILLLGGIVTWARMTARVADISRKILRRLH